MCSGTTKIRTYPDFVVWYDSDFRGVALRDGGETYFELGPDVTVSPLYDPRLLTPGNKVLVLVDTGHHIVHLLWSIPEHTVAQRQMHIQWDEIGILIQILLIQILEHNLGFKANFKCIFVTFVQIYLNSFLDLYSFKLKLK